MLRFSLLGHSPNPNVLLRHVIIPPKCKNPRFCLDRGLPSMKKMIGPNVYALFRECFDSWHLSLLKLIIAFPFHEFVCSLIIFWLFCIIVFFFHKNIPLYFTAARTISWIGGRKTQTYGCFYQISSSWIGKNLEELLYFWEWKNQFLCYFGNQSWRSRKYFGALWITHR